MKILETGELTKEDEELLRVIKSVDQKLLKRRGKAGVYDYTGFGGGGDFMIDYSTGTYVDQNLPEVTITPNGGYWDPTELNMYNNFGQDMNQDYGGGGGGSNDAMYYTEGNAWLDHFEQSIQNDTAVFLKGSVNSDGSSTAVKVLTATSDGLNFHSLADMAIQEMRADVGVVAQLGRLYAGTSFALNASLVYVGFTDGKISASDWCLFASTLLGGAALASCYLFTPAAVPLEGLSFCFGVASMLVPGDNGTPGGMGTGTAQSNY